MLYHNLAVALFAAVALANPVPEGTTDACSTVKCKSGYSCHVDKEGNAGCEPNEGEPCGDVTCGDGEYCCNDSCSICSPIGDMCTMQLCQREEPKPEPSAKPVQCGPNTCDAGEVCCNESCGICAPPDGACTLQICFPEGEEPETPEEPEGEQCGSNTCSADEYCCNSSCGICAKEGAGCTKQLCGSD